MFGQKSSLQQLLIVILSASTLAGCGAQGEVSYKSGGTTETFAEGNKAVPKEFQTLVYPKATTTGSVSADGENEEQSKFLILTVSAPIEAISKWYQQELSRQNWKVDKVQDMPKLVSITGHKEDTEVNVMIAEEGSKTTISLQAGKQGDNVNDDKEPLENYAPDKVTPPTD
jgi:hypothetical protein